MPEAGPLFWRSVDAQFIRNLAVASSGVAGGAVGSVAGGILFSPLGPFGALTGRVVGGVLGGMIASAVSGKIAGALVRWSMPRRRW
nr:hypothetical protein [Escherichia coli]